ncbi:PAS/PAC sensor signal transduction histidine kinase [Aminobacter aminovorans]|uniref:histidine kinase n=1 Tax=Aminobacter aminovorans TaxID=83263 RepID=A0A380WR29_AMIAI|nr:PAS domain S-box protein [Aminobacter aminovorans]TCS30501.1 PAS/PAC sensor signal transduction histidine kinase [Aminobacter aminovorans]SUU91350.1 Cell-division control histidine kinase pdhS [Aminobacter aminovorans]
MPSAAYSFIDVAVVDRVRQRFAAGDAIVVLSVDLEDVLWANGPGAVVLGYDDIDAVIGAPARLGPIARRQIAATSGFPEIGRDRSIMVRVASGLTSNAVAFVASSVRLPDGAPAIMLAVPAGARGARDIAANAISGFTEQGHFLAFLDAHGEVEAATEGFARLGIAPSTLAGLVSAVGRERDRIIKRAIPATGGYLPAGLARLTDEPARHLLVVVDERLEAMEDAAAGEGLDVAIASTDALKGEPKGSQTTASATAPSQDHAEHDHWYFSPEERESRAGATVRAAMADRAVVGPVDAEFEAVAEKPTMVDVDAPVSEAEAVVQPVTPPEQVAQTTSSPESVAKSADVLQASEKAAVATEAPVAAKPAPSQPAPSRPAPDRSTAPVRFVWRTDAEGRFSAISPEFAAVVGDHAADVVGRRFQDVSTTFELDPSGEIAGLLQRRDTWSGRSVLWPVAGTDRRIPVDLAALPVYGRDRSFEGFRGFGVARPGEAVVDHERIGLALVPNGKHPEHVGQQAGVGEDRSAAAPVAVEPTTAEPVAVEPTASGLPGGEPAVTAPEAGDAEIELAEPRPVEPSRAAEPSNIDDPFAGEVPALEIDRRHDRRYSDKVIRLAEHRLTANEEPANGKGLSSTERSAFREIGEKLKRAHEIVAARQQAAAGETVEASAAEKPISENNGEAASAEIAAYAEAAAAETAEHEPTAAEAPESARTAGEPEPLGAKVAEEPATRDVALPTPFESAEIVSLSSVRPVEPVVEQIEIEREQPEKPPLRAEDVIPSFAAGRDTHVDAPILEQLPVPVLIHAGDVLHYANAEFLDLTGYGSVDDLARAGGLDALFAESYGDEPGSDHDLRLKTRDGEEFPIEAVLRSVPWQDGKALMLVVRRISADDDVEGAVEQVAELEERLAEMRTIIDTATDGVVLIDRDGAIRSISRPAEALFGFDSDEVTGKPFYSLFAIESQRAARDYLVGLSEHGVASVLNDGREVIGRESQGRFIPLFMTIGRLPNDSGFCAVVRDITQWKRAEEELTQARAVAERSSSQKTDFLARISHEIRTPLNAIIGFSELMVDEKFGPVANDRYRDYLRDINRSGNHVLSLVNDLLDISKIEAGQQEMDYEAVSLNDTLAETVAMMQPQANRERVIIRSSFASRLPEIVADRRSIRQIALNVLSNAVRYTQAGGQVIVSTSYESSGDIVMRVRDTGIGMSQAEIEQALKPFKQINSLKRSRGDGTGLGLPLTKAMVEANRARFAIASTPGEGTLFEVTFPSTRVLAE